ncbi:MAG: hypothetical protein QM669_07035 [Siphonobacter sp.]
MSQTTANNVFSRMLWFGGADTIQNRSQMQWNLLVIDGVLYGISADNQYFDVDGITGKEIWQTALTDNGGTISRGVSYWTDGQEKRILFKVLIKCRGLLVILESLIRVITY